MEGRASNTTHKTLS